ncbi:MAG: 16S rRNA (guanine(527)-N(7))-methyltransferase RsmG [Bacteroidota bacterium]
MKIIEKYFPELDIDKHDKIAALQELYLDWNSKINVISRKDIENIYERHVLHSLAIAKVINFVDGSEIMDIGTGGGFPGIPLAIMFPEVRFHLVDSIGKKVKVASEISEAIGLKNLTTEHARAESLNKKFDFVVSRAVTTLPEILGWCKGKIKSTQSNDLKNGLLYLKGGDFHEEISQISNKVQLWNINKWFDEEFFETKRVAHVII